MSNLQPIFTFLAAFLCGMLFTQSESMAQASTIQEIADGTRSRERMIFAESQSFQVRYTLYESEDVTPTEVSGGQFLLELHIGRNQPDEWYSRMTFHQETSSTGISLSTDPNTSMTRDGMVFLWRGGKNQCYVDPVDRSTEYFKGWDYFQFIGIDPYRPIIATTWGLENWEKLAAFDTRFANDLNYFQEPYLPETFDEHEAHYTVHEQPEAVDGFLCWVVEWPGMHKLWIDVEHGFAVRRRIVHWGPDKPRKRDTVASDIRELKPGLWLPHELTVERYADVNEEKESVWGAVANRAKYRVDLFEFDQNIDHLFAIDLPPGLRVNDFVRDVRYFVPAKGVDPFEEPLQSVLNQVGDRQFTGARKWLVIFNLLLIVIALVYLTRKRLLR